MERPKLVSLGGHVSLGIVSRRYNRYSRLPPGFDNRLTTMVTEIPCLQPQPRDLSSHWHQFSP